MTLQSLDVKRETELFQKSKEPEPLPTTLWGRPSLSAEFQALFPLPPLKKDSRAIGNQEKSESHSDFILPLLNANPLLKKVKEQAQWFHSFKAQDFCELPDAFNNHGLFEPTQVSIDYECLPSQAGNHRLRMKVNLPSSLKASEQIKVSLELPKEQMVLISDMSLGSWSAETLLVPVSRSVFVDFRVFSQRSNLISLTMQAKFAEQFYLATTPECFTTTLFQSGQNP